MSGVSDSPFVEELGVLEGVVDEGNTLDTASASSFTWGVPVKSMVLFMGAVVSVGYKRTLSHQIIRLNICK